MKGKKILLIVGAVAVLGIGAVTGGVALLLHGIKSCGAYTQAVDLARKDPRVQEALGSPVETRWWVMGSVQLVNDGGHAELTIPLRGPKGEAGLQVEAVKAAGAWTLKTADFEVPERETLSLLP